MSDTVAPQDLPAEENILGAMLISTTAIAAVQEILEPDDFYRDSHAHIYRAIVALHATGTGVDAITVSNELRRRKHLDDIGGEPRLAELISLVPAASNAPHWARIVKDASFARQTIQVAHELNRAATTGGIHEHPHVLDRLRTLVGGDRPAESVKIVSLGEFVSVTEDSAEPLLGTSDENILPGDGMLLMYGDGGAGKTTLTLDAVAHIASATPWLGQPVPRRSRILIVENEGPRGKFRQLLNQKINDWAGNEFAGHVYVLEEPWTRFTFTEPGHRAALAAAIDVHQIDIVVLGPLATIGMTGGGTPDEVNTFTSLLDHVREQADRPFSLWILHHENKAGDVSGAWERVPDTLLHIQAQGNGRTRIHWRKVRWASSLHGTSTNLTWGDGKGYEIELAKERDYRAELIELFTADNEWRTLKDVKVALEAGEKYAKEALSALVEDGTFEFQVGPEGRHKTSKCWRLRGASEARRHPEAPTLLDGFGEAGASLPPPSREAEGRHVQHPTDEGAPDDRRHLHLVEEAERLAAKHNDLTDDDPPDRDFPT